MIKQGDRAQKNYRRSETLPTSPATATALPPAAVIFSMIPCNLSFLRAIATTIAPSCAKRFVIASPMPELAPVTMATLSSNFPMMVPSWISHSDGGTGTTFPYRGWTPKFRRTAPCSGCTCPFERTFDHPDTRDHLDRWCRYTLTIPVVITDEGIGSGEGGGSRQGHGSSIPSQTARNSSGARLVASITILISWFPVQVPAFRLLPSIQKRSMVSASGTYRRRAPARREKGGFSRTRSARIPVPRSPIERPNSRKARWWSAG